MPRARVNAIDRQRQPKACIPCRIAKRRCSSQLPCSHCIKQNSVSLCAYQDGDTAELLEDQIASPSSQAIHQESAASSQSGGFGLGRQASHGSFPGSDGTQISTASWNPTQSNNLAASTKTAVLTQPRMLRNAKGDEGAYLIGSILFLADRCLPRLRRKYTSETPA
jgi:hypothetical protein